MFVAMLMLVQDAPAMPPIQLAPAGQGFVITAAPFDAGLTARVDAEADARAKAQCGGLDVRWGEFSVQSKVEKTGAAGRIDQYRREFSCASAKAANYPPAPADWKPSSADEADVRRVFAAYYDARDAGRFDAAYAMFEPEAVTDRPKWIEGIRTFAARAGKGSRRIAAITWYVNPAQASHPGVFAAIDFVGDFPGMHFYCGFVGLYRRGPGDYGIVHEEQNSFAKADGAGDSAQVAQFRAAYCRGQ